MNTDKTGMRTVLAAAAAGALIMGSAAGAMATGKPDSKPAPQTTVKLQSVSIKGHKTIDVVTTNPATLLAINVRATVWDPKDVAKSTETVTFTLAAYTKKVNGEEVKDVTPFESAALIVSRPTKKSDRFAGSVALSATTIAQLQTYLTKDAKTYLCVSDATVTPEVAKYSMQVQKRLGVKGPATDAKVKTTVRDCVKVIDSTP